FAGSVPDCLGTNGADCRVPRARAMSRVDPLVLGVQRHPSARLVDLTSAICGEQWCEPVVGNVVAWRDAHHMTATFARTLAPALARAMAPAVAPVPPERVLGTGTPEGVAARDGDACADGLPACLARARPALAAVAKDIPPVYRKQGCHSGLSDDGVRLCTLGDDDAGTAVFVIGDSHAAQWFPVYEHLAAAHGLRVRMTTKAACSFADVLVK